MDCFTCQLYNHWSAFNSFLPHINSKRSLKQESEFSKIFNLHIESENLPSDQENNADFLCVAYYFGHDGWEKYARTEVNFSQFCKKWIQPVTILSNMELFRFEIYQIISDFYSLKHQKLIGDCEVTTKELLKNNSGIKIPLRLSLNFSKFQNDAKKPSLIIKHRELQNNTKGSFYFKAKYTSFMHQSMYSFLLTKPSYYFEIEIVENNILVYRSNYMKLTSNQCLFDSIEFNQQLLIGNSLTNPIRFILHEVSKKDTVLLSFETTIDALSYLSLSKYPIDNVQGFSVGEFEINFIGSNLYKRIDDLRLSGISFQTMFALDFSCGKQSCDSFRVVLNEVGDSLNNLAQQRPYIAFGFGCINDKQNIFTFRKSVYYNSIKTLSNSYKESIIKIEKLPKKSKMIPAIEYAKKLAIQKWNESQIFSIITFITNGNLEDASESISNIVGSENLPIIFIIVTTSSIKNKLTIYNNKEHFALSRQLNEQPAKRKMFKIVYYTNGIVNLPQNLKNLKNIVIEMIQEWANVDKKLKYNVKNINSCGPKRFIGNEKPLNQKQLNEKMKETL